MSKKVAILGLGFIGSNLLDSYLKTDAEVTVFDRKPCPTKYHGSLNWIEGNFSDLETLSNSIRDADVVYHLISSTVPADDIDEHLEVSSNVLDTINLLKLCVRFGVKRLIFFSSSSVYGAQSVLPITEIATTDPISTHGIHKLTIEKYIQYYNYRYNLNSKILRLSNPYGFGQNLFGRQGLIAICLGRILNGEELIVMGDGNAIRDFIHVEDVVAACHLLSSVQTDEIVFNVGSGIGVTLNDVFGILKHIFGDAFSISYKDIRKSDISASILDISKAKYILGFAPNINLEHGISLTINRYLKQFPELEERFTKS